MKQEDFTAVFCVFCAFLWLKKFHSTSGAKQRQKRWPPKSTKDTKKNLTSFWFNFKGLK